MTEISLSFITCVYFNTISTRKLKYSYRRDLTKANRRKKKKKKGEKGKLRAERKHTEGGTEQSKTGLFSPVGTVMPTQPARSV